MKLVNKLFFLLVFLILVNSSTGVVADGDHHHPGEGDHAIENHCDNPTEELNVVTELGQVAYTEEEYTVPKNTCVKIIYQNKDLSSHDFNIDAVTGSEGIQKVHIHLANNTDGPNGDGIASQNIMTPDTDTEFSIYCTVSGHRASGMEALLIVGESSSFLPITPLPVFLAIMAIVISRTLINRMQKNTN